ncbi:LysR substrate-binding domain-containing protein [Microbispora sp. H10836]|uniref:LysR substrate-binding domain-containing protein n=1 Tax=Microbispora sp. H10836 TaxID=2729106 RepID=UPI002016520A|nr:LysR substrate-binding domain-containing protein [Microbispora sp. H10836]
MPSRSGSALAPADDSPDAPGCSGLDAYWRLSGSHSCFPSAACHVGFDVEPLADVLPHVVLPERHALADQEAVSLRDLAVEPMVLFDVSPSRDHWVEMVSDIGLEPLVAYRTRSFETTRCLVGQGLGYAVLVQRPRNPRTYAGSRVVTRPIREPVRPRVMIAAYPTGMRLPDKVRAFLDYCRVEVPRRIAAGAVAD